MKKKIVVLGVGMVGLAITRDLAKKNNVLAVDINRKNLSKLRKFKNIEIRNIDLSKVINIKTVIESADLVINAVPGFMGYKTLKTVISAGKNVIDIAFSPEDTLALDALAKENKIVAVVDCGVAPGMSNAILGYHNAKMEVEDFTCYVGGLPKVRTLPFQYKAPFSPIDVIEEYIRPVRYVKNHRIITKPALSDPELIEFEKLGTLEAFNTDGLRSLIQTMKIINMKEKTLRYPGHLDQIKCLQEYGFFQTKRIEIGEKKIKPVDLTTKLLTSKWELKEGESDLTVMKIIISGIEKKKRVQYVYDLYDEYDIDSGITSMARTTGYFCTAVAELVLSGYYDHIGVSPPELIGAHKNSLKKILKYQTDRNIIYKVQKKKKYSKLKRSAH